MCVLFAGGVQAQEEPVYEINIPAQNVANALEQLADQTGAITLFPYDLTQALQANAVVGSYTLPAALDLLLKNTGLSGGLTEKRVISISTIEATARTDEEEPMEITKKRGFAGLLLAIFGGSTAIAQDATESSAGIEEIVVTALKQETTVQDAPVALSVLTGDAMREAGIYSVTDLPNIAPGVEINQSDFGPVLSIRGVTTTDNTSKGDQGIAFMVDGIVVGRPREQAATFFDVDRVEVLRGPQGTLYGKSTSGGVINVITRRPGNELGGNIDFEFGNFDTRRITAAVDMPISDQFRLRLAYNSNNRNGWLKTSLGDPDFVKNTSARNDEDSEAHRISAVYDFSDNTSLFLSFTKGELRGTGGGAVPFGIFQSESGKSQRVAFANPFESRRGMNFDNMTAELTTAIGESMTLTYLGGIRDYKNNSIESSTYDPELHGSYGWINYQGTGDTTSHELRVNGETDRVNWVAGYNYFLEELWESDHRWFVPFGVEPTLANSLNDIDPLNNTDHKSSGFFGQMTFAMNDRLNLTLGLRSSQDEVKRRGTFAPGPGPWDDPDGNPCIAPAHCVGFPNNGDQDDSKNTYRLGLDYGAGEDGMFYGSVSTGYKAGGFNDFGPSGGPENYIPENLMAYEIGYKGTFNDNMQYNTSLYYYDYDEAQIQSFTFIFGPPVLYTFVVPVKIQGWENELTWFIGDNARLVVEARFADSEYVDFEAGATPPTTNWDGVELDRVPKAAGAIEYLRDWHLGNGATLTGRIRSRYSSGYKLSVTSSAFQTEQDSFTRTDLNVTYTTADERFSVGLFARNLEDELQATTPPSPTDPGSGNGESIMTSEPRTIGFNVSMRY